MTDKDRAEALVFRAWEEETFDGRRERMEEALSLDPRCVDAIAFLALQGAETPDEAIEGLRQAVAIGEVTLGPKVFKEDAGSFWSILETQPYMRARTQLAQLLRETGQLSEALEHLLALVALDSLDHQGNQCLAEAVVLEEGDVAKILEIVDRSPGDGLACAQWAWVLARFLTDGPAAASSVLETARAQNPYVEKLLLSEHTRPESSSPHLDPGDVSEAKFAVAVLAPSWDAHPPALEWLQAKCRTKDADEMPTLIGKMAARVGGDAPDWLPAVFEDVEAVSDTLIAQVQAFGAEAAPWLLAVLRDGDLIAFHAVGGGYAPGHAAHLLGCLGVAETAPPLVETLHQLERAGAGESIVADEVLDALLALGLHGVEAVLLYLGIDREDPPEPDSALHDVLAEAKVKSDAILEVLAALLDDDPAWAAQLLERYGDAQALGPLHAALDRAPTEGEDGMPGSQAVMELGAALESLGGRLTEVEEAKQREVVRIRRRAMGGQDERDA